jgi:DNA-binding MarR family transcriptional regulator
MSIKKIGYDIIKQRIFDILHENPDTTKQELADRLGVRYQTLYGFLRKHGICVPRPHRNRLHAPQINSRSFQVLGYLVNHPYYTLQHIADQFDVSREYVSQIEVKGKAAGIIK